MQYTANYDQVASLRITWSDSERNLTLATTPSLLLFSLQVLCFFPPPFGCPDPLHPFSCFELHGWHLSKVIPVLFPLGAGTTSLYLAPVTGALPLQLLFLQGSNKKVPPATQLMRVKQPGSHSAVKREKRFSTSSFPLSANRELQKLAALAGMPN